MKYVKYERNYIEEKQDKICEKWDQLHKLTGWVSP